MCVFVLAKLWWELRMCHRFVLCEVGLTIVRGWRVGSSRVISIHFSPQCLILHRYIQLLFSASAQKDITKCASGPPAVTLVALYRTYYTKYYEGFNRAKLNPVKNLLLNPRTYNQTHPPTHKIKSRMFSNHIIIITTYFFIFIS